MLTAGTRPSETWPSLPLEAWKDTYATLHLWTQIVGKIRLAQTAWVNHSWNVTLYVTSKGLTTGPVPHGNRTFQIDFDFVAHVLHLQSSDGRSGRMKLQAQTVAAFYGSLMAELQKLDLHVDIVCKPNEVADAIPFDQDHVHNAYQAEYANRFWRILMQSDRVFQVFRARFSGKCSPVHFFWGAPDLAVTRFSGRPAPRHPGGVTNLPDWVARDAYCEEVSSCGFWPGGGPIPYAAFYSYAYPEPRNFAGAPVLPQGAFYSKDLNEFIVPYDVIRESQSPDEALLQFLQTTYDAAADLGGWDRDGLERRVHPKDAL
jgi:hypothetical protein